MNTLTLIRHSYLKGYFSLQDGGIDKKKLNIATYDPLLVKKLIQFVMLRMKIDFLRCGI